MSMRKRVSAWVGGWLRKKLETKLSLHKCGPPFTVVLAEAHKKCMHGAHKIAMMAVSLLLTPSNYAPSTTMPALQYAMPASAMVFREEIAETLRGNRPPACSFRLSSKIQVIQVRG